MQGLWFGRSVLVASSAFVRLGLSKRTGGKIRAAGVDENASGSFPFDKLRVRMTREQANARATAKASWLGDGLHPTHRKMRDGWDTRQIVAGRRTDNSKSKCGVLPHSDFAQGQNDKGKRVAAPLGLVLYPWGWCSIIWVDHQLSKDQP